MTKKTNNSLFAEYSDLLRTTCTLNNKVLLIQCPQFLFDSVDIQVVKDRGLYAYPPTGLQSVKSALSQRGLDVKILDCNFLLLKRIIKDNIFDYHNWLEIVDDYLKKNDPSIVGVTCTSVFTDVTSPMFHFTSLLQFLSEKEKYIVMAGGPIATNEYEFYLKSDLCHFVVTGEGENKVNFIFDYLYEKRPAPEPIKGIFFKTDNTILETDGNADTVSLKGNLISSYEGVPVEEYNSVGSLNPFSRMAGQQRPYGPIHLNRGCRANCKFCGVTEFMGDGLRQYPVNDVIDEIKYLVKKRGIRHFEVLDDDFIGKPILKEKLIVLLREMAGLRQEYEITWSAGNGLIAGSLDEGLITLINDSGCVGFRIGIESGNDEILKLIRKPVSLKKVKQASVLLQKFPQIFVDGNYIIGFFGEETFGQMMDTYRFSCEVNLDWSAYSTFQFTSKATAIVENLKVDGKAAGNFIPTKDSFMREVTSTRDIISGPDIFLIPKDTVPSRDQVKQIWFTFNLLGNYINNKNLKPEGKPEKFTSWVEAIFVCYPDNPYMALFAGLGHILLGNKDSSIQYLKKTKKNLLGSNYWEHRFKQFGLFDIVNDFPRGTKDVYRVLSSLQSRLYKKYNAKN